MLEKIDEINMLKDFYGKLLTDRQQELLSLYYEENLSMTEIAESLAITKQGVSDGLKKAEAALRKYEGKLGLLDQWKQQNSAN